MNKLLTLAILGLLSVKLLAALPTREHTAYRDSVYRQIIKEGNSQFNCYLSYLQGDSQVIRSFSNNTQELDRLNEFIQKAIAETSIYIQKIYITGYCSIEGAYEFNDLLSKERIQGFINFINKEYNLSNLYSVESAGKGEDWETLRNLITNSSIPERNEMIQIIKNVRNPEEREMRLRILNGGQAYKKIYDELFPLLRRVNIKVEYNIRQIIEDNQNLISDDEVKPEGNQDLISDDNKVGKSDISPIAPPRSENREWNHPIILKTNLMSWIGITPDIKFRTFMPNLAAEIHLSDNWSVMGSVTYSYWNFDNNQQFWGVSGYSIEPRYWLNRFIKLPQANENQDHSGLYIGGYIQYGDFDFCLDVKGTHRTDNYTGNYTQAGISIGYHVQITPVWGIELGVREGYQYSHTKIYDTESPKHYLKEKVNEGKIKVDGLNLSVTYKFE